MIIFLTIFIIFSFISTVLKYSLAEKRSNIFIGVLLVFLFSCCIYPLSIRQTNQTWLTILQNREIVSVVSVIQIIEAILAALLSVNLIKEHFKLSENKSLNFGKIPTGNPILNKILKTGSVLFSMIPSVILLGGIFLLEVYFFLHVENIPFQRLALALAAALAGILVLSVFLFRLILRDWETRAELKIMVSFIQVLLAMFLPIIVNEIKIPYSTIYIDIFSIVFCAGTLLFFIVTGYLRYRYFPDFLKNKKYKLIR